VRQGINQRAKLSIYPAEKGKGAKRIGCKRRGLNGVAVKGSLLKAWRGESYGKQTIDDALWRNSPWSLANEGLDASDVGVSTGSSLRGLDQNMKEESAPSSWSKVTEKRLLKPEGPNRGPGLRGVEDGRP